MFDSLLEDIKHSFRSGNMVTRLVIINLAVFVVTALTEAFAPSVYGNYILPWIAMPADPLEFIYKPWTIFTTMFVHSGLRHIIWNMLFLYWFGRIVGDLIGDRHILPLYLLGGMAGAVAFSLFSTIIPGFYGGYCVGASAAIMAIVMVAGIINPNHVLHLILFRIEIKYVVAALIFLDLLFIGHRDNTGGHVAHIGGMILGYFYMAQLGRGVDYANKVNGMLDTVLGWFDSSRRSRKKSPLKVHFKSDKIKNMSDYRSSSASGELQQKVDQILEKIKSKGYESLTEEEKETLYQASKK